MTIAFAPPAVAASIEVKAPAKPKMPDFSKRPWHVSHNRLDGRPVIWSLKNRPEDWKWDTRDMTIKHVPSNHTFWVSGGEFHLWDTNCSCSGTMGRFGVFQYFGLRRAYKAWRSVQRGMRTAAIQQQFINHFAR